jgi:hypothetical protein
VSHFWGSVHARQYGIDEISLWGALTFFTLPGIPVRRELGSAQDLIEAIQRGHEAGVNIAPFISIVTLLNKFSDRYGVKPGGSNWTYHDELIPEVRPYYTKASDGFYVDSENKLWRQDALAGVSDWINRGVSSFTWDQFEGNQSSVSLAQEIRKLARAQDPQSTFSGESIANLELESPVLDYTWNWVDYEDASPITNVLRSPRLNCNVDDSSLMVKKAFADNLYINVMPRKPDQPNGTALIGEKPALGKALEEVARLRQQFLPYFVDGTTIGDSVLWKPAPAFVRGYQLENKLLIVVLNDQKMPASIRVESDLSLWLPPTKAYAVKYYDSTGKLLEETRGQGRRWSGVTRQLRPLELAFFEIQSQ